MGLYRLDYNSICALTIKALNVSHWPLGAKKEQGLGSRENLDQVGALLLTHCVTRGQLLSLSEPQVSLYTEGDESGLFEVP